MPGVKTIPKLLFGSCPYLFVLGGVAAGGFVAPVSPVLVVSVPWLHPASMPTRPNSTIRVYNLFIGRRNVEQNLKKDK